MSAERPIAKQKKGVKRRTRRNNVCCDGTEWQCLGCKRTILFSDWYASTKKQLKIALYCVCCDHQFVCTTCVVTKPMERWYQAFGRSHSVHDVAQSPDFVFLTDGDDNVTLPPAHDDPYYHRPEDVNLVFPSNELEACQYLRDYVSLNRIKSHGWSLFVGEEAGGTMRFSKLAGGLESEVNNVLKMFNDSYKEEKTSRDMVWRLDIQLGHLVIEVKGSLTTANTMIAIHERLTANVTRLAELAKSIISGRDTQATNDRPRMAEWIENLDQATEDMIGTLCTAYEGYVLHRHLFQGVTGISMNELRLAIAELRDAYVAANPTDQSPKVMYTFNRHHDGGIYQNEPIVTDLNVGSTTAVDELKARLQACTDIDTLFLRVKTYLINGLSSKQTPNQLFEGAYELVKASVPDRGNDPLPTSKKINS